MGETTITNNELLGKMGDYPKFQAYVAEQLKAGYWNGKVDWTFRKKNYDPYLYDLNREMFDEIFAGREEFTVTIEWSVDIR